MLSEPCYSNTANPPPPFPTKHVSSMVAISSGNDIYSINQLNSFSLPTSYTYNPSRNHLIKQLNSSEKVQLVFLKLFSKSDNTLLHMLIQET